MLSQDDPPTAVFAYSDTTAWGVMEAAQELGIAIPDDFSLIGFDNIEIAEYLKITTIYQPLFDSGQRGMQLLLEKLENPQKTPIQEQQHIQLISRQTTSTPK
jgi:DNA-binding LacI/PurR family transcriptional regulator